MGGLPAAGFLELLERKEVNSISDETLILAGMAEKSLQQVHNAVVRIMTNNGVDPDKATYIADMLSTGKWTHDYPASPTLFRYQWGRCQHNSRPCNRAPVIS